MKKGGQYSSCTMGIDMLDTRSKNAVLDMLLQINYFDKGAAKGKDKNMAKVEYLNKPAYSEYGNTT